MQAEEAEGPLLGALGWAAEEEAGSPLVRVPGLAAAAGAAT